MLLLAAVSPTNGRGVYLNIYAVSTLGKKSEILWRINRKKMFSMVFRLTITFSGGFMFSAAKIGLRS